MIANLIAALVGFLCGLVCFVAGWLCADYRTFQQWRQRRRDKS
jgi:hypothetical protein